MNSSPSEFIPHLAVKGEYLDAAPFGFGHIHDTYVARFRRANGIVQRVILQRINDEVFKQPAQVMDNIELVTHHIRARITAMAGDAARGTLTILPTIDDGNYWLSPAGTYWRAFQFIEGAKAYQRAESPSQYYHAGKAFGRFLNMLSDFDPARLYETIPNFHHTPKRFQGFIEALEVDPINRAASVPAEIDFALERAGDTETLLKLVQSGEMPQRVTHNDTKFDNVMLDDKTGEGVCVIDLDTVMPGMSVFDFGDAVRTGANPAAEDEPILSRVYLDLEVYKRLSQGFIEEIGDLLTEAEADHLAFGAKLITFEQGIRFLTDYLQGDVYYKIHRPLQNLDRCRTQFKLVADMERNFAEMESVIARYKR